MKKVAKFGSKTISARIPTEVHHELIKCLKREKMTVNELLEIMVFDFLKSNTNVIQCMECMQRFQTTDPKINCPNCNSKNIRIL
jgi:Zn finger protein HypA/HybF involved in hydrogenase expression